MVYYYKLIKNILKIKTKRCRGKEVKFIHRVVWVKLEKEVKHGTYTGN